MDYSWFVCACDKECHVLMNNMGCKSSVTLQQFRKLIHISEKFNSIQTWEITKTPQLPRLYMKEASLISMSYEHLMWTHTRLVCVFTWDVHSILCWKANPLLILHETLYPSFEFFTLQLTSFGISCLERPGKTWLFVSLFTCFVSVPVCSILLYSKGFLLSVT